MLSLYGLLQRCYGAGGSVVCIIMTIKCGWRLVGGEFCPHLGFGQFWLVSFHVDLLFFRLFLEVLPHPTSLILFIYTFSLLSQFYLRLACFINLFKEQSFDVIVSLSYKYFYLINFCFITFACLSLGLFYCSFNNFLTRYLNHRSVFCSM